MWQTDRPHSYKYSASVPGKVFLYGEYAVLAGLPAVIATLPPRFELDYEPAPERVVAGAFSDGSPAGLLLKRVDDLGLEPFRFKFVDPHQGEGGFGASSAYFSLIFWAYCRQAKWGAHWNELRALYQELTSGAAVRPSGADLVAQWQGGVVRLDLDELNCTYVTDTACRSGVMVFSATGQKGRKVATHEHLAELRGRGLLEPESAMMRDLVPVIESADATLRREDFTELGRALSEYGDVLKRWGLEVPATSEDRMAFGKLPGVMGVKGAGALQADALVVVAEQDRAARAEIMALAEARGLRYVGSGQDFAQPGIQGEIGWS